MQNDLEILAVTRIVDLDTEEPVVQVVLGEANKMTPQIRSRIIDEEQSSRGEVYSKTIVLTLPLAVANKYRVGSKWRFSIDEKGAIELHELK